MDQLGQEGHSHVVTRPERDRYDPHLYAILAVKFNGKALGVVMWWAKEKGWRRGSN